MRQFIPILLLVVIFNSCINEKNSKIIVGMTTLMYDSSLESKVYTSYPLPPPFEGSLGTFNICMDTLFNFYYYTFKPTHLCGYMLQDIKEYDPYLADIKALCKEDFYPSDLTTMIKLISKLDRKENYVSIGLPRDTIINQDLNKLIYNIHSINKLSWKTRKLNDYEKRLINLTAYNLGQERKKGGLAFLSSFLHSSFDSFIKLTIFEYLFFFCPATVMANAPASRKSKSLFLRIN